MDKVTIIEGTSSEKDNARLLFVKGERGYGIKSLVKTDTDVLVDTYTITFDDDTTTTFTVTNGKGIESIEKTSTSGLVDTYTITFNDNTTGTFTVTNAKSITSIEKTGTSGLIDTYTITYNDNTTSTFTVTNGKDGELTSNDIVNDLLSTDADKVLSAQQGYVLKQYIDQINEAYYFQHNETLGLTSEYTFAGMITTNSTEINFDIFTPKKLDYINSVQFNNMTLSIRSIDGYVGGQSNYNFTNYATVSILPNKEGVHITLTNSNGWGVTNNTPVSVTIGGNGVTFTFIQSI